MDVGAAERLVLVLLLVVVAMVNERVSVHRDEGANSACESGGGCWSSRVGGWLVGRLVCVEGMRGSRGREAQCWGARHRDASSTSRSA